jgi:phosphohistidine phosphatase
MCTLYVMRHCKSRWDEPEANDHERGLTGRGKRDARLLGRALAERAAPPDLIVSSTARRARATARRVARAWGYEEEIRQEETIYEGGPLQCLGVLRGLPDGVASVLLVGHNPTLENLLWTLGLPRLPLATGETVCLALALDRWGDLSLATEAQERFRLEPRALRAPGE